MDKYKLLDRIKNLIGGLGWKMFCWSYPGGEDAYLKDIYDDILRWKSKPEMKKKRYKVYIERVETEIIEVEAESREMAEEIGESKIPDGGIVYLIEEMESKPEGGENGNVKRRV